MEQQQAHAVVTDAERAVQSATERLARAAHQAVDTLSTYGGQAEERIRDTTEVATERSREIIEQVRDYVEQNPVAAIGIAVAVGFTVGLLMRAGDSQKRAPSHAS